MTDKVRELLLDMEVKLDLINLNYNGFRYWQYYRSDFFLKINKEIYGIDFFSAPKALSKIDLLKNMVEVFSNKKYAIFSKMKKADYMFMCDPMRRLVNGKEICSFTDFFIQNLDFTVAFERPYNCHHLEPAYTEGLIYLDRIYWIRAIENILPHIHKKRFIREVKAEFIKIDNYLCQHGIRNTLNIEQEVMDLWHEYVRYNFIKRFFKIILKKIKPKIIFEVQYYCFENMVLNEIAKEIGVKTVEIQHGATSKYAFAYNCRQELKVFPDYFFVYGDFWKEGIEFPMPVDHIKVIGSPYFEMQKKRYGKVEKQKKVILFLSQDNMGYKLSDLAVELMGILREDYEIIFKLHPTEFYYGDKKYQYLCENGIKVLKGEKNLYELFAESSAMVGICSTALYEGLGFGLPVFLYNTNEVEHMRYLIEKGYARLVDTAEEIANALAASEKKSKDLGEFFWKSNSIDNFLREVSIIAEEQEPCRYGGVVE